jgi:hypothetical protein
LGVIGMWIVSPLVLTENEPPLNDGENVGELITFVE